MAGIYNVISGLVSVTEEDYLLCKIVIILVYFKYTVKVTLMVLYTCYASIYVVIMPFL